MAGSSASILSLTFFLLLHSRTCTAICYYPDGQTIAPQDVPCLGGTGASACCGPGYACLSNGLCMHTNATHDDKSTDSYVRGSCTDQQWRAAACPAFCIGPNGMLGKAYILFFCQQYAERLSTNTFL